METSNLKSGKLSKLGRGQNVFIFRGEVCTIRGWSENFHFPRGCPIRGFNFLGGLYPFAYYCIVQEGGTSLRGQCNSGEWGAYFYIQGVSSEGHSLLHGGRINKIGLHNFVARPTLTPPWKTLIYIIYNSKFVYRLMLMKKVKVKLPPQSGCSPEAVEPHP